ncbi:MAG: site-2 protease family protein [Candidatus Asgardarchaeia archaeon]
MDYLTIIIFLSFWIILYAFKDKINKYQNLEVDLFILLLRSHKLNKLINRLANKYKVILDYLTPVIIVSSLVLMVFVSYFISLNLVLFFYNPATAAAIQPLIPGITITIDTLAYMVIPIIILVATHELAHGVIARASKVSIKSAGLVLFLLIPGAFVEIDEKYLKRVNIKKKLTFLGAGSFANMLFGVLAFILILNFSLVISPFYSQSPGILVTSVVPSSPAANSLKQWDIIYGINGTIFNNVSDFYNYMDKVKPGETLLVNTSRGVFVIKAGTHPQNSSKGFLGITSFSLYSPRPPFTFMGYILPYLLYLTLNWTWILGINFAIFNMLPIPPLDGDKFLSELINATVKDTELQRAVHNSIRVIFFLLLVMNIILSFAFGKTIPL